MPVFIFMTAVLSNWCVVDRSEASLGLSVTGRLKTYIEMKEQTGGLGQKEAGEGALGRERRKGVAEFFLLQ